MATATASAELDFTGTSARLSATAIKAFGRIAELWRLSPAEQRVLLGSLPESTFYKYLKTPESARLSRDTLDRISNLIGIFKSINVLLPRTDAADTWVRRPNTAALFKGRSALDYMLGGRLTDIADVRAYLDTQRGW